MCVYKENIKFKTFSKSKKYNFFVQEYEKGFLFVLSSWIVLKQ